MFDLQIVIKIILVLLMPCLIGLSGFGVRVGGIEFGAIEKGKIE